MRKIYSIIAMMLLAVCPKAMAEEEATLLWSATGDYYTDWVDENSPIDGQTTIEAYSDGTYVIKNYFKAGGNDLSFTVADEKLSIITTQPGYLYNVSGTEAIDIIWYDESYSSFTGDKEGGDLYFWFYYYPDGVNYEQNGRYYYFAWPSTSTAISSVKAETSTSDRITSITGIDYGKASKLPAGLYVKNGKKFIAR